MAAMTTNSTDNVSSAKGVKGGYIFTAPVGSKLPTTVITDASQLDKAFTVLGFISEDGYVETIESDSEDIVDMNGDLMDSPLTSRGIIPARAGNTAYHQPLLPRHYPAS